MTYISRNSSTEDVVAATLYLEARGESEEGQIWVVNVIKNRAKKNKSYWGGSDIKQVCLQPSQFSCWNGRDGVKIYETAAFENCKRIVREVLNTDYDPSDGADHYINPNKANPSWAKNLNKLQQIGNHQFYKSK